MWGKDLWTFDLFLTNSVLVLYLTELGRYMVI